MPEILWGKGGGGVGWVQVRGFRPMDYNGLQWVFFLLNRYLLYQSAYKT